MRFQTPATLVGTLHGNAHIPEHDHLACANLGSLAQFRLAVDRDRSVGDNRLAGTAARFLTALCATAPRGTYRIDGVPQMRKRPMNSLIVALRSLGADIRCPGEEGFFPLEIRARGLHGGPVSLDASESSDEADRAKPFNFLYWLVDKLLG